MKKLIFSSLLILLIGIATSFAQTGVISGKVTDELTGEELVGASVKVKDTNPLIGTSTDLSGDFQLRNIKPGTYTVIISYVSYSKQEITEVVVTAGNITTLNVALKEKVTMIDSEVVIRASFKKNTANALLLEQKRSVSIGDGISAEDIRKAPVSNSGDVIKKVSGASIQGGKFAVIRGLNDRYNTAYLNGAPLPSTEPDRRAFSFDIIPAGMLDQMIISKTATPDMPGDFSGGIIKITTKDFPELNFYNLSVSSGFNTITTFKDFASYEGGKLDFLGLDDGTRQLPDNLSYNPVNQNIIANAENTNKFNNNYGSTLNSAMPNMSLQYSMGIVKRDSANRDRMFSAVLGVTYSRSFRFSEVERQKRLPLSTNNQLTDSLQDKVYNSNVLWGIIGNFSYKFNKNHRVSLKNLYNVSTEDQTTLRTNVDILNDRILRLESYFYKQNNILASQLSGDHFFPAKKIKFTWVAGANFISRLVPDYRIMQYQKNIGAPDNTFLAPLGPTPNVEFGGRFFSKLNESLYSTRFDVSKPIIDNSKAPVFKKMEVKVGVATQTRSREFTPRFVGWTTDLQFPDSRLFLPIDEIFAPENTQSLDSGFILADLTNASDRYTASSNLLAGYIMFDNSLGNRFRVIWGARYEAFNQKLNAQQGSKPLEINNDFNFLLPSANLVYKLTSLSNLRAGVSRTVSRPEFRELAPFSFFDFNTFTNLSGNDSLQSASIMNYDLRYEYYPKGNGELISVSAFYKDFTNPIENIIQPSGTGTFLSTFQNVPKATNFGGELEIRKKLSFLNKKSGLLNNSTVFGNFAYIISRVDLSDVATATSKNRPLQGQSNYIINAGVSFRDTAHDLDFSATVNRVGKRIAIAGTGSAGLFPDVWEQPRTVIDLQVSKTWGKFALKLSISDLLAQPLIYYMDRSQIVENNNGTANPDLTGENKEGQFDGRSQDVLISRTTFGRSISVGLSYKF